MSLPAPGVEPTKVPRDPHFTIVQPHRRASAAEISGETFSAEFTCITFLPPRPSSTSAMAKSPINAGMNGMPSIRLTLPKRKRG
jgi:hypothetical protein